MRGRDGETTCGSKKRYASRAAAKRSRWTGKARIHAYLCRRCRGWHMGGGEGRPFVDEMNRRRRQAIEMMRFREAADAET